MRSGAAPTHRGPRSSRRRHHQREKDAGIVAGRPGAYVRDWLAAQSAQLRKAIEVVVIDTCAPYACRIRAALPHAKIAVDKWHLVALTNQMLTEVRQRITRERYGRRGTTAKRE